jgi:hypothetical protein
MLTSMTTTFVDINDNQLSNNINDNQLSNNHKTHNPLISSYSHPDFPPALFLLTSPTQGIYPFTNISPLGVSFVYQGLSGLDNQESLNWGLNGTCYQENYQQTDNKHLLL